MEEAAGVQGNKKSRKINVLRDFWFMHPQGLELKD